MSGTAFGTIVLHVSPESAVGGLGGGSQWRPDFVLSVSEKAHRLLVDPAEIGAPTRRFRAAAGAQAGLQGASIVSTVCKPKA